MCSFVVYIERKCQQQISKRKLKYKYKFTHASNYDKLNNLHLVTSKLYGYAWGVGLGVREGCCH